MTPARMLQFAAVAMLIAALILLATGDTTSGAAFVAIGASMLAISAAQRSGKKEDDE